MPQGSGNMVIYRFVGNTHLCCYFTVLQAL